MWVSNEVKLGNTENATYSLDDWEKVYASIKVNVEGDFLEKTVESPMLPENGAGVIMSKLGTDGLVAINNDGRLYTGEGVIREYRYSGPVVNNYIITNDTIKILTTKQINNYLDIFLLIDPNISFSYKQIKINEYIYDNKIILKQDDTIAS